MFDRTILSEENYQKSKGKMKIISALIILTGVMIGGSLIYLGISKNKEIDNFYSEESIKSYEEKINKEEETANQELKNIAEKLEQRKEKLKDAGIKYNISTTYEDKDAYELKLITDVLNPSFNYCHFDEYINFEATKEYCNKKAEIETIGKDNPYDNVEWDRDFKKNDNIPFFMFGGFIILASIVFTLPILTLSKRRELLAFTARENLPIAEEVIEKLRKK